jgi:hypothetical protein
VRSVPSQGSVADALEGLLALEKAQRLAENSRSTKLCCQAILEVCFDARDWKLINEHVVLLAKRRSQLKQVSVTLDTCTVSNHRTRLGAALELSGGVWFPGGASVCTSGDGIY